MQITNNDRDDYWRSLVAHTAAELDSSAPWPVLLQLAALLGDDGIAASYAHFNPRNPSTWSVMLVTVTGRLIKVEMEFDAELYHLAEDTQPNRHTNPVERRVNAGWSRLLSQATRLDIGKAQTRFSEFDDRDRFGVGDVSLTFTDGEQVNLRIDQLATGNEQDLLRADKFLEAIRAQTGL